MGLWVAVIFSFLLSSSVFGEDSTYILVRQIQGAESINPALVKQIEKSTLQVVMSQPGLELLLSGSDTPEASLVDILAVETEIRKEKDTYRIEARLIDVRTKKQVERIEQDYIPEQDLLRIYQSGIETLFIPWVKSKKKKLAPLTTPPPSAQKEKMKDKPKMTKTPPPASLDFRKIVQGLKTDVDEKIEEVVEAKEEAGKINEVKQTSANMQVSPEMKSEEDLPEKTPEFLEKYDWKHRLYFGFDNRNVTSDGLINATAKVSFFSLSGVGYVPLVTFRGKVAGGYEASLGKAINGLAGMPTVYKIGGFLTYPSREWIASLGVLRESLFFANLASPGATIQPFSLNLTWLKLKADKLLRFERLKGTYILGMSLATALQGQTSYKPLASAASWSGYSLNLNVTPPFKYKQWESNIALDYTKVSSQGDIPFSLNESRIAFNVRRSL